MIKNSEDYRKQIKNFYRIFTQHIKTCHLIESVNFVTQMIVMSIGMKSDLKPAMYVGM
jgi:hypothetical protein